MNKIFKVITRQGRAVVCDETTMVGGGKSKSVAVAVALALGASTAAWADIDIAGGDWNNVGFTANGTYNLTDSQDVSIDSLKGENNANLTINAQGNNFSITNLQFSMSGHSSTLTMNNVGNVNITNWYPYSTTTKISADKNANASFSSSKTDFYNNATGTVTATLENFASADLGDVTFNEKTVLTFNSVTSAEMDWQGGTHGDKSSITLNQSKLEVEGSDKVKMGTWSLQNASSLTLKASHTTDNIHFSGTDNEVKLDGNLKVTGYVQNLNTSSDNELTIQADGHNIDVGILGIGANLKKTTVNVTDVDHFKVGTFNFASGELNASGDDVNSSTFKATTTNINGHNKNDKITLSNFKEVDFGTFDFKSGVADPLTLTLNSVESAKMAYQSSNSANGKLDLVLSESNLAVDNASSFNTLAYGGKESSLTLNGDLTLGTLKNNIKNVSGSSNIAQMELEKMTIDAQGHDIKVTDSMSIGFHHAPSELLISEVGSLNSNKMSLSNCDVTITGKESSSSTLKVTEGVAFYSGAYQTQLNLETFKEVDLGKVTFNQKALISLKDVTSATMNYQGGSKATQAQYVLSNSKLTINSTPSSFVADSFLFKEGNNTLKFGEGVSSIFVNDILTEDSATSTLDFSGSPKVVNVYGDVKIDKIKEQRLANLTFNLLGANATFNITGKVGDVAVPMNQSKLTINGTGSQSATIGSLQMGNRGLAMANLKELNIEAFDVRGSTTAAPEILFSNIHQVKVIFSDSGESKSSAKEYPFKLENTNGIFDVTALTDTQFIYNVSSSRDLTDASHFSKIEFKNDDWDLGKVNLQKGAWLAVGDKSWDASPVISQALGAFANEGKNYEKILSLGGTSTWGTEQKLKLENQTSGLLMVVNGATANNNAPLWTGIGQEVNLGTDIGFYLKVNNEDFKSGDVLQIADGSIWAKFNGQAVGANNIFTDWVVEGDGDSLNFKLAEIKSVTEVLPDVIPEKGFEEIFGHKVPGRDGGEDQWEKGVGSDQLINKETGEVGVGGPLAEAILSGGLGDSDLTTEIANTFAAFGVAGGAQSGASTVAQMGADALARHYSFATTTGVNPLEVHKPGTDLWVDFTYTHDKVHGLSNGASEYGHRTNLHGFALGLDNTLDENLTVGGVFNYIKGRTDSDQGFVDIDNDTESFGLTAWAGWNVNDKCNLVADISYAKGSNKMTSALTGIMAETFQSTYQEAAIKPQGWGEEIGVDTKADIDTETFSLGARAEHIIRLPYMDVIPHIGVRWDHIKTDDYRLKIGGHDAIHTSTDDMNVISVPVGVAIAKSKHDAKTGWNARVSADAYVMPRFGDTEAEVSSRFAAYTAIDSGSMEVMSDFTYGMSLGAQIHTKKTSFGLNAGVSGSDNNTSASLNANFVLRF